MSRLLGDRRGLLAARPQGGPELTVGPHGEPEPTVEFLELDQLVSGTSQPVPRLVLSGRATAGLWALRIMFVLLSVLVIYTFVASLG